MPKGDAEDKRLEKIYNDLVARLNKTAKGTRESAVLALATGQPYKALRAHREKKVSDGSHDRAEQAG